jgi:hypothetical protein
VKVTHVFTPFKMHIVYNYKIQAMKSRRSNTRLNTTSGSMSEATDSLYNEDTINNKSLSVKSEERIFEITKWKKTRDTSNESLSEGSDEEYTISEGNKRISADSKVNFNKLGEGEKDDRLKNLSVLITRLRKKIRNLEGKLIKNHSKNTKEYINNQLTANGKGGDFNIDNLIKALNVVKDFKEHEYDDEKTVLENFIHLLAEGSLTPDSIHFKKICSQIRLFLNKDRINFISKKGQKIIYSFKERDVYITPQEFEMYKEYKNNEKAIRTILGINQVTAENTEKITFGQAEGQSSPSSEMKAPFPKKPSPNQLLGNLMSFYANSPQPQNPMTNPLLLHMMPMFRTSHLG